ncbi:MAG: mitochondrial fission ELM1 family protein [Gammaproteobacteria bacterium]|nr:mitochondrial fission ELM1 family protein [Gammaproteobacteria bacterium]
MWRFADGRRGHDSQSLGLVEAIGRLRPIRSVEIMVGAALVQRLARMAAGTPRAGAAPKLIVGAGRRTHLPMLAARRRTGARAVVLMRPGLTLPLFDLALVPEHDEPPDRANVIATRGALNRVTPAARREADTGLIAVGGPSAHYGWDERDLDEAIATILAARPRLHWTITDSPRTPAGTRALLGAHAQGRVRYRAHADTTPDWLASEFGRCAEAWVSADSVSMVYEALTGGARVGILEVPVRRANRVSRGLAGLAADRSVTLYSRWLTERMLPGPATPLAEAERCARLVLARWFADRDCGRPVAGA